MQGGHERRRGSFLTTAGYTWVFVQKKSAKEQQERLKRRVNERVKREVGRIETPVARIRTCERVPCEGSGISGIGGGRAHKMH